MYCRLRFFITNEVRKMSYILEEEQIEKVVDGVEYVEEVTYKVYDNGSREVACTFERRKKEPETSLTEQEEISIDTALNVEYMVCLMEETLGLE